MFTTWKTILFLPSPTKGQVPIPSPERPTQFSPISFANLLLAAGRAGQKQVSTSDIPFVVNLQPKDSFSPIAANPSGTVPHAAVMESETRSFPAIQILFGNIDGNVPTGETGKEKLPQVPGELIALPEPERQKPLAAEMRERTDGVSPYRFIWPSPVRIHILRDAGGNPPLVFSVQEARYFPATLPADFSVTEMPAEKGRVQAISAEGNPSHSAGQSLVKGENPLPPRVSVAMEPELSRSPIFSGNENLQQNGLPGNTTTHLPRVNKEAISATTPQMHSEIAAKWVMPTREGAGASTAAVLQLNWPGGERVEFVGKLEYVQPGIPFKDQWPGDLPVNKAPVTVANEVQYLPRSDDPVGTNMPVILPNAAPEKASVKHPVDQLVDFPKRAAGHTEPMLRVGNESAAEPFSDVQRVFPETSRPGRPIEDARPKADHRVLPLEARKGWQRVAEAFRHFSEPVVAPKTTLVSHSFKTDVFQEYRPDPVVKNAAQSFSGLDNLTEEGKPDVATRPAPSTQKDAGAALEAGSNKTTTSEGGRITQSLFFGEKPLNHPVYSTMRQGMDSAPKSWGQPLSMQDMTESFPSFLKNWIEQVRYSGQTNRQEIWIRLKPASLGLVRIQLKMEGDRLTGKVETSHPDALRVLQQHYQQLMDRLRESQIDIQQFDLSLNRDLEEEPTLRQQGTHQSLTGNSHQTEDADAQTTISGDNRVKQPRWLGYNTIDYIA
ncbi:MAG: hypothetical protein GXO78_03590 [Calditrichaeota bacterium]|nr:hypothetical protein [Calditrichota bacterium]